MNEAFTNLAILGGYVALGYLVYWGYEWLWWRYVDWYLDAADDVSSVIETKETGCSSSPKLN